MAKPLKTAEDFRGSYLWKRRHVPIKPETLKKMADVLEARRAGKTLKAIGDSLGLSKEQVRWLEAKAIIREGLADGP